MQVAGIGATGEKGVIKRKSHQRVLPAVTLEISQREMREIYHSWTAEADVWEPRLI